MSGIASVLNPVAAEPVPVQEPVQPAAGPPDKAAGEVEVDFDEPTGPRMYPHDSIKELLDREPATAKPKPPAAAPAKPQQPAAKPQTDVDRAHIALNNRIQAAKRIEERAERRKLEAEEAYNAKIQAAEARIAELERLDELAIMQEVAKRKGIPFDQMIKRAISRAANGGKLPEGEQTRSEIAEAKKQAQAVQDRLDAMEAERVSSAKAIEEAHAAQIVEDWQNETVGLVDEANHPLLSALDGTEIANRALKVAQEYFEKTGVAPDQVEVLEYLEQLESERFEKLAAKRRPPTVSVAEVIDDDPRDALEEGGSAVPDPERSARQRPRSAARPLTNRDAAERSTRQKPMTERERIAYAAEAIPD